MTLESDDIQQVVQEQFERLILAAKTLDFDAYFNLFDPQRFTALNADGTVVHRFDDFAQHFRQQTRAIEAYESLEFSNVQITPINGETAVLVNEYQARVRLTSGAVVHAAGGGTQVWASTDDGWRLVNVSSSQRS